MLKLATKQTRSCCIAQVDFMPVYAAHLREVIKKGIDHPDNYERPLEGFRVIVDAGNGSGGFLASDVLAPLGADTTGEICCSVLPRRLCLIVPYPAATSPRLLLELLHKLH